jgi:peptidyl-prolyl cis-trans isomerase SurA
VSTGRSCRSITSANTGTEPSPPGRRSDRGRRARVLSLVVLSILVARPSTTRAAIVEEIVAKVNNRIISKSEFEERGEFILRQVYQQYSGEELDRQLREAQDTLLANLITELLLLERAESLLDLDKVRKNLIDDFRKQQDIKSDEDLARLLQEQGMSRKDLEEQLIRLAVPQEIISYEVRRKISVSEKEIKEYYDGHPSEWETPPTVTFREIVLFYEEFTKPEVMTRALGIVRESKAGAEFADLVARYSESGSKDSGGLLGPLPAADFHPAIAAAAFALGLNQVSEPIDTGRSLHIIRPEARTPRIVKTIEEARDAITDTVRQQKFRPRYDRYLKKIWRESHVEVLPKYRHFLVSSPIELKD